MSARIGSLCSGYAGLDMAVEMVLDVEPVWFAQYDPDDRHQYAAKILAHHWPDVPNHGDITTIDYRNVEPIDVLTAGFPCTDLSLAGKRAGLREGTRSGIWSHVARAIGVLRPQLVFLENVRSLTSAYADCGMEFCPWCLGDSGDESALRALGAVLGDLAGLGFDAQWRCLRACDVGACHIRERIFILAWPAADTADHGHQRSGATRHRWAGFADDHLGDFVPSLARGVGSNAAGERRDEGRTESARLEGRSDAALGCGQAPADADGRGLAGQPQRDGRSQAGLEPSRRHHVVRRDQDAARPGVPVSDALGVGSNAKGVGHGDTGAALLGGLPATALASRPAVAADTDGTGWIPSWRGPGAVQGPEVTKRQAQRSGRLHRGGGDESAVAWGQFEPAIRRWEAVLGRPAPSPTELRGRSERGKLSPAFVEHLMGLPEGWVTGVPGIPVNAQLRALGNGVVPQQGAHALRLLLADRAAWQTRSAA